MDRFETLRQSICINECRNYSCVVHLRTVPGILSSVRDQRAEQAGKQWNSVEVVKQGRSPIPVDILVDI